MKIRSICVGIDASWPLVVEDVQGAGRFLRAARARFEDAGVEVQTTRLALSPFAELRPEASPDWVVPMAQEVEAVCQAEGIEFTTLGPVRWSRLDPPRATAYAAMLPDAIGATEQVSASIETAANGRLYPSAARAVGETIARLAHETPLGFGNFRFCAVAECGPNIPFFPSAYHAGGPPRFTIGLEAADDVRRAFVEAGDVATLERRLVETLGASVQRVETLARRLAEETGVSYGGTDLTPAPFPADAVSSAGMLEDLGVGVFGGAGTLTAASILTGMLKRLPFQHVGFSGLMLPVLEDSVLAARTAGGHLTWRDLLLYSAVCGTGLDTVPLPGDAAPAALAAVTLDVAALAVALHKPLSCRLFPVPGKAAGDLTEYDFPYFANARVLALPGGGSDRLLDRLEG
ncbi:MAG: DUF711 family protein [Chloroflexi bacterium]|nr:DUF711 family protein [Chloroflexota bacterium]